MKNIKQTLTLIISILLVTSCGKTKTRTDYHYLKVENKTKHEVRLSLFDKEMDTLLREYFINPNQTTFLDTAVYHTLFNDGKYQRYISGGGYRDPYGPFWNTINASTQLVYIFDNFKISQKRDALVSNCDTNPYLSQDLCNYGTIEKEIKEIDKRVSESHETTTYFITEQQYILADTI